jgi:integrase
VLEALDKLRTDLRVGLPIDTPRMTLADFLTRWLEDVVRVTVRHSTYCRHKELVRLYISSRLGGISLSRLTPMHIQSLLADLEKDQKSPRLRQMVRGTLHAALNRAVKWNLVARNVCDAVEKPRAPRPEMKTWSPAQVTQFLATAQRDRLYALYVVALTAGMRLGEILGTSWADVDLKASTLSVRRQLTQDMNLLEPKTAAARRLIVLPEVAVAALKQHRGRMFTEGHLSGDGNPQDLVFVDTEGHPLRQSNLLRRSFFPLMKEAGVQRIRFHDLRHTCATLLLTQGVHPKIVQERLGHATISMTLDTYSHVTPTMQQEAAAKLDALFAP